MTAWVDATTDLELIGARWPDAPSSSSDLQALLDVAQVQCAAYAPALADGTAVPENYRLAVILQAKALQVSGYAGGGDQIGSDFPVRVFPMDWTVKALLRPATGIPGVF